MIFFLKRQNNQTQATMLFEDISNSECPNQTGGRWKLRPLYLYVDIEDKKQLACRKEFDSKYEKSSKV